MTPPHQCPGLCLRHGDFHPMSGNCWDTALDWYFDHQHLDDQAQRDEYAAAVERRILDRYIREHVEETPMPSTACDPDGERQPQPQRQDDDLPTAA